MPVTKGIILTLPPQSVDTLREKIDKLDPSVACFGACFPDGPMVMGADDSMMQRGRH